MKDEGGKLDGGKTAKWGQTEGGDFDVCLAASQTCLFIFFYESKRAQLPEMATALRGAGQA